MYIIKRTILKATVRYIFNEEREPLEGNISSLFLRD